MHVRIPVPADFSFEETLTSHGWRRLAPFAWLDDQQAVEHVQEFPDGQIVRVRFWNEEGEVVAETDKSCDERELTQRVRRMLQLDFPLADFYAYCAAHAQLVPIAERRQGRLLRSPSLFEDTVKVIATTNTTWAQTISMTQRLVDHFGAPLPEDPERHAFPTPARIAAVPVDEFSTKARMGYRSAYVHAIATAITEERLDLESWQDPNLTAVELRKRLLSLPGIGPYGAACLMLYLGKPEHVNTDSWARALVSKELGRSATDKDVHAFFEDHGPWRGLVYTFFPWQNP